MGFPLWLRILLSSVALVPVFLLWRTVVNFSAGLPENPFVSIPMAFVGVALVPLTVWYLRDLWRVNPQRRKADWAAEREAARIARAFARERQGIGD